MPRDEPRYLRFARALALVTVLAPAAGCETVRNAVGCEHCYCGPASRSLSRPVSCDLAGPDNCCRVIEGPLPPPDLPA